MSAFRHAPAFDFYPERWTHGTRHMNKIERCDYIDLLCHQWTEDGIPDDLEVIARILNYKRPNQIPKSVLSKFPVAEEGKRRNKRLEIERVKQKERYEKKSLGASKTNAKRWQKESLSDQLATKNGVASESPPPTSDLRPEESEYGRDDGEWINRIQAAYPDTAFQNDTRFAIRASMLKGHKPEDILAGTKKAAELIAKNFPSGIKNKYVAKARSFFEGELWEKPENHFEPHDNGNKTHKRRDSGDLNLDDRYA